MRLGEYGGTNVNAKPSDAATTLDQPVETVPGIGAKRAEALARLGIETVRDLIFHFPRTYEDRRTISTIADLREGDTATISAEVVKAESVRLRGRMGLARVTLRDASGTITAVWFGQTYLARVFKPGARAR